MVFPRYIAEQEDPEILAERELAEMELNKTEVSASVRRTKETSRAKEAAAIVAASAPRDSEDSEDHRLMDRASLSSISNSSASIDTVASSTGNNTVKAPKETKAERKKRARGVSGCSIKKGGEPVYGDFSYDDYDEYDEDEEADSFAAPYGDAGAPSNDMVEHEAKKNIYCDLTDEFNDGQSELWLNTFQQIIVQPPKWYTPIFVPLVGEGEQKKDDNWIVRRLHKELQSFYDQRLTAALVGNRLSEYKLSEMIRHMLDEGIIRYRYSVSDWLDWAVCQPHEYVDHIQEIYAWTMMEIGRFDCQRLKICTECPPEPEKVAKELVRYLSVGEIAHLVQDILPWWHAEFVYWVFHKSLMTMSLGNIYVCVQAISELYEGQILSKESVLIGLHRLVRDVPDMEKDLPCAASMVHLLFSYATAILPVTNEDKEDLPPPKHLLYGSLAGSGHLEVRGPSADMGQLSADNFIMLAESGY